jgi:hypothetical protein
MAKQTFEAKLERPAGVGTWTYLNVAIDVIDEYGVNGHVKVKGTIDGVPFRSSLMPHGDGRHYLVVNKTLRDQIKATTGSVVRVVVERDSAPRTVTLPRDFQQALAREARSKAALKKMPYSHLKEYVDWIESAKRPETRARRIASAIERVTGGARLKG